MYKFKSRAAGDIIMLEPNGRQILAIIGKLDGPVAHQGILLPTEMPAAIGALEAAVADEEEKRAQLTQQAQTAGQSLPVFEGISLRLRTVPLIAMIRRCHKADKEIVWGV
jgi:hypothetical protein